jgi:LssY C-terminus
LHRRQPVFDDVTDRHDADEPAGLDDREVPELAGSHPLQKDWRSPGPWTAASALGWLSGNTDPLSLPVIPYFESGRAPSLTMIRPRDDSAAPKARFVVRLWASGFQLRNGASQNLWVGSVVEEHLGRFMALFTVVHMQPDVGSPQEVLTAAIGSGRLVTRGVKRPANTGDGQILLAHDAEIAVE